MRKQWTTTLRKTTPMILSVVSFSWREDCLSLHFTWLLLFLAYQGTEKLGGVYFNSLNCSFLFYLFILWISEDCFLNFLFWLSLLLTLHHMTPCSHITHNSTYPCFNIMIMTITIKEDYFTMRTVSGDKF